eukprot:3937881-Rhodomonas_salina.2
MTGGPAGGGAERCAAGLAEPCAQPDSLLLASARHAVRQHQASRQDCGASRRAACLAAPRKKPRLLLRASTTSPPCCDEKGWGVCGHDDELRKEKNTNQVQSSKFKVEIILEEVRARLRCLRPSLLHDLDLALVHCHLGRYNLAGFVASFWRRGESCA